MWLETFSLHAAEASELPAAAPGRVLDAAPAQPPAAAAEDCDTATPATAADNDDGSDVFIGGTPDGSDADGDDSDDPEVDLDALSEPTVKSPAILLDAAHSSVR